MRSRLHTSWLVRYERVHRQTRVDQETETPQNNESKTVDRPSRMGERLRGRLKVADRPLHSALGTTYGTKETLRFTGWHS